MFSALINALDGFTPKQHGENAHAEHGWSNSLDEKICQYFFQLVRSKDHTDLENQLKGIVSGFVGREKMLMPQMCATYKLIGQTRDIPKGKGEQQLAFMQLWIWSEYYPDLAMHAFEQFVILDNSSEHPYGSWRDLKYWCEYVKNKSGDSNHYLINHALSLAEAQLHNDWEFYKLNQGYHGKLAATAVPEATSYSLLGRWFPREKSKFGWLHALLANKIFGHYLSTAKTPEARKKAILKGKILLTKRLVSLNKELDTPQVKMCGGQWSQLNFNGLTTQTTRRQKLAIQNKTKKGETRSFVPDRVKCAEAYEAHLEAAKVDPSTHKVHGKRCMVYELVKDALNASTTASCDTTNLQWDSNRENNKGLEHLPIVSMVDTSSSMTCDDCIPLYNAIGLGIRTSELSHPAFRNRIMTFDSTPKWLNLEELTNFVSKAKYVQTAAWGGSTNFYGALKMILDCILQNQIPPREVKGMVLAVYSDMQINANWAGYGSSMDTMFDQIQKMYVRAGLQSKYNTPYPTPSILFWNLRKTTGFPTISTQKNVTFLSGYNSSLLDVFCGKGIEELKKCTPHIMLDELLNNPRYDVLERFLIQKFP